LFEVKAVFLVLDDQSAVFEGAADGENKLV
jgi:hypothetical protein